MLSALADAFDIQTQTIDEGVEVAVVRRAAPFVALTVRLPRDYPIAEPRLKFRTLNANFTSLYIEDKFYTFGALFGSAWSPVQTLSQTIERGSKLGERSLMKKSRAFSAAAIALFVVNACFGLFFLWAEGARLFRRPLIAAPNPLLDMLARVRDELFAHSAHRRHRRATAALRAALSSDLSVSVAHLVCVGLLVFFALVANRSLLKPRFAAFLLLFVLSNPLTVLFAFSNHIANIGLALFVFAFMLPSYAEPSLAVLLFLLGQLFYPSFIGSCAAEFGLLQLLYTRHEVGANPLRPGATAVARAARFAARIGGYALFLYAMSKECAATVFAHFRAASLGALRRNAIWFPLSAPAFAPALLLWVSRDSLREKDGKAFLLRLLLLHGLKGGGTLAAELAILILLSECAARPRSAKHLSLLLCAEAALLVESRSRAHAILALLCQTLNLFAIFARNSLMKTDFAALSSKKAIETPILKALFDVRTQIAAIVFAAVFGLFFGARKAICAFWLFEMNAKSLKSLSKIYAKKAKLN